MKKIFLLSFITLFTFSTTNAQAVSWPDSFINTGINSTYLIQSVNMDGSSVFYGYVLGAFFENDNGNLQCAGFTNCSSGQVVIAVMADDTTTAEKDGFYDGEEITWLAYGSMLEQTYTASLLFSSSPPFGSNLYSTNGLNIVNQFNISSAVFGCINITACNFNANATEDDNTCTFAESNENCDGTCIDTDGDLVCDIYEVLGCTNISACNYNEFATEEDNSCIYPEPNFECNEMEIIGCIDTTACNYNELATVEGQCFFTDTECQLCSGEIDGSGVILFNDDDLDGVCNQDEIYGCTDLLYTEYSTEATEDDNSCQTLIVLGCTDINAFNYDENVNTNEGNCVFEVQVDFETTGTNTTTNFSVTIDTIDLQLGDSELSIGDLIGGFYLVGEQLYCAGFTSWTGTDFSINLWLDDPASIEIDGLTENATIYWIVQQEETMFNYLVDLTLINAPGVIFVSQISLNTSTIIGCMESTAYNYNSAAVISDGACEEFIEGCTDTEACNFDETANTDDGSCYSIIANIPEFQAGQGLNVETDAISPTYVWYLNEVVQEETSNQFTPYINGIYTVDVTDESGCSVSITYNLENIGIEEIQKNQISLFPNPAESFVEINSTQSKIESLKLYSITGQLLQEYTVAAFQFKIERNSLPNGIYFIQAIVNGNEVTKRVLFK